MIRGRSTDEPTPLDWLDMIQRGGTDDWRRLYAECRERAKAEAVAQMLKGRDPDLLASARLWKFLLEELHPGLVVDLHEDWSGHAV